MVRPLEILPSAKEVAVAGSLGRYRTLVLALHGLKPINLKEAGPTYAPARRRWLGVLDEVSDLVLHPLIVLRE
jgi:hypothetical protein